jgi:membrane protein required for colicin V production
MLLDIIFAVLLVLAVLKGYHQGLLIGVFSLISVIIGLAAAIKLSAVVASWIGNAVKVSDEWLPLLSFIVVFITMVLLIRLGAKAIERTFEVAMLGWVNKLGGVLFFTAIYILVYSILLFYAEQMRLLQPATIEKSVTYPYIKPWGPKVIDQFGAVIPLFKDMFKDLEDFFGHIAEKIS